MAGLRCAFWRTLNSKKRFFGWISRMYFLRGGATARSGTGLVEQSVQIVASHDPTFVVRPHSRSLEQELDFDRLERKLDATFGCAIKDAGK